MKKLGQRGFSPVEIILVIVVVSILGFVGWFVWNQRNTDSDSAKSDTAAVQEENALNTNEETNEQAETKYLDISEYGLKVVLTSGVEDAYYVYKSNNYVYISTESVNKYPYCRAAKGDQYSGLVAISYAKVGDDNFGSPFTKKELEEVAKLKIGDTYYWLTGNQSDCTDGTGASEAESASVAATRAELLKADLQEL